MKKKFNVPEFSRKTVIFISDSEDFDNESDEDEVDADCDYEISGESDNGFSVKIQECDNEPCNIQCEVIALGWLRQEKL